MKRWRALWHQLFRLRCIAQVSLTIYWKCSFRWRQDNSCISCQGAQTNLFNVLIKHDMRSNLIGASGNLYGWLLIVFAILLCEYLLLGTIEGHLVQIVVFHEACKLSCFIWWLMSVYFLLGWHIWYYFNAFETDWKHSCALNWISLRFHTIKDTVWCCG